MTEPQHQALSDLMDGELDAGQTEAVLDALCRDEALATEWHRMHRIRGLMRHDDAITFDVSTAVREALANEPTYLLPGIAAPAQHERILAQCVAIRLERNCLLPHLLDPFPRLRP